MSKATSHLTGSLGKYLALPFEVYYAGPLYVYQMELLSDQQPKRFRDVKLLREAGGKAWRVIFRCGRNHGTELICTIFNRIEMTPQWLEFLSDEVVDMNYTTDYRVSIRGKEVSFIDVDDEDDIEQDLPDAEQLVEFGAEIFYDFDFTDACPTCIVLDCDDTRVTIDVQGFVLDRHGERTKQRLFDPDLLADSEDFEDYEVVEKVDAKRNWLATVLQQHFSEDAGLTLSLNG